ncbi:hypothetical protein FI667_g6786, partial [Globisporangium splendens]
MTMQFSSSSQQRKPTILDGYEGLVQYSNRCTERVAQFERYEREGVFDPSKFRFINFLLFAKLQIPANTEIDAVDFLNGAQFACDLAMNTMYSREFINFAIGAIKESRAAETLKQGLSPECYEAFLYAMTESSKSGNTFDLKQLDINGVYLTGVEWDRLTLAEYKAEQGVADISARVPAANGDGDQTQFQSDADEKAQQLAAATPEIDPADYNTFVERMFLDVLFETKEHLDVTTADGQDQSVVRDSSAVWRFESLVTHPDDIDWKIVNVS